jgi:diaminopimelate decarboxylase
MPYKPAIRGATDADAAPIVFVDAETTGAAPASMVFVDAETTGATPASMTGTNRYRIGGNSCLSGDFIGDWFFEKPLEAGDKIIFEDMIHYTTVKTTMFNGIPHPSIAMLHTGGDLEIYRTFTYEDYKRRMD